MLRSVLTMETVFKSGKLLLLLLAWLPVQLQADVAVLIQQATLVETNPEEQVVSDDDDPIPQPEVGSQTNASYLSSPGWAVTSENFIDAATYVFDMGETTSVTAATLRIPIRESFPQNGSLPVEITFFSDNGVIEFTDYTNGFNTPISEIDLATSSVLEVNVAGAINSSLNVSRFIGFRIRSAIEPSLVDETLFPPYTGVRFTTDPVLEFVPGAPPSLPLDTAAFDVHTLVVPEIKIPSIGEATAEFRLIDPENLTFELTNVTISEDSGSAPAISGAELFNCSAFAPPVVTGVVAGAASYSTNSGILDAPSVDLFGDQLNVRLELIDGSNPPLFETLTLDSVQSGPSGVTGSALRGGLLLEPGQDFVSLCHGWVLVGDFVRHRVVERNIISGETGATYPFNTAPDQFTLDKDNNLVYMTVFPESERLYKLDLVSGNITSARLTQTFTNELLDFSYTYGFALRDVALGEGGNIFALLFDGVGRDPENQLPFAESGLWMGLLNTNGEFLIESLPLLDPIRIEYDPVQDHVFLATESNLATLDFNPTTNAIVPVPGTDIPVGAGCTDFDISPDGTRLAYACPNGNYTEGDFSIADMDPEAYYNNDGSWYFGSSPISATFNADGTLLIGTDNEKLYVFDVKTHLILEDFELGLIGGETIRKVRLSADGNLIYIFLNNPNRADNSKFYWMPMPAISGTPL